MSAELGDGERGKWGEGIVPLPPCPSIPFPIPILCVALESDAGVARQLI